MTYSINQLKEIIIITNKHQKTKGTKSLHLLLKETKSPKAILKERKESLFRIQSYISLPYLSAHSRLKSIKNHKGYTRI